MEKEGNINKKIVESNYKNNKENTFYKTNPYGISLIVLVITIIVIIILAAAIILTLNKNNPIEEANRARIESDVANMQAVFTNTVAKIMAKNESTIEVEEGEINSIKSGVSSTEGQVNYKLNNPMDSSNTNGKIIFDSKENSETTYYTGKKLPIYASGETTWYVDKEGVISLRVGEKEYGKGEQVEKPAEPVEPEQAKEWEIVKDVAKEYIDKDGEKATIPIDFAIVPGKTDISNGLVISDVANDVNDIGNQFVWIPVENMEAFVREQGYFDGSLQTNYPFVSFSEPFATGSQVELEEYEKMKESIREYKGFYIGRYEISNDGNNKAQSKKNKDPWTSIKWGNSMTDLRGGIVEKAREMYPEEVATKGKAVSTLVYGVCWDETIRFIRKNYPGVEKDSSGYGNYGTGNKIKTGSNEAYALNNIYDMAGNVMEWTMEVYTSVHRTYRGGGYDGSSGLAFPMSYRSDRDATYRMIGVGGRCQLYIK